MGDNKSEIIKLNETTAVSEFDLKESPDRSGILGSMEGTFAEFNTTNRNNRVYTKELWESVIDSDYVQEMMENNTLFGEADHPEDRFEISLPEISHVVTDLWIDEDKEEVRGKMDILDTPNGRILKTIVEYGSKIGISSRACGSIEEKEGSDYVKEDDYTFFTFDTVSNPGFEKSRLEVQDLSDGKEDEIEEENNIDYEAIKEKLIEEIESAREKNLELMRDVVERFKFDEDDYKELVEKIDEKQMEDLNEDNSNENEENESESKNEDDNPSDSMQENTLSLLEQTQRELYKMESKEEDIQEKLDNLEDEVNNLSEGLEEKFPELDIEVEEIEESDTVERIDNLHNLINIVKEKIKDVEINSDEDGEGNVAQITEEQIEEFDKAINKLKKEKKSKEIYAETLEKRVKMLEEKKTNIEESKTSIEENKKELVDKIDNLRNKLDEQRDKVENKEESLQEMQERIEVFRDYVVTKIAGRTGINEDVVRKYVPEDLDVEDIEDVEREIKEKVGVNKSNNKIDSVYELNNSKVKTGSSDDKEDGADERLSSLVKKVGGKK